MSASAVSNVPATEPMAQRLRAAQLALLCDHSRTAIIGAAVVAWYVCWLLLSEHSVSKVGLWYGLLIVVSVFRLFIQRQYLTIYRKDGVPSALTNYQTGILIGIALNGAVWCLPSTWLLLADPTRQVMMTVFLVGLSAAGIASLAPVRFAYSAFIVPFMLPIAWFYFRLGHEFTGVGAGIAAFTVIMVLAAQRSTQAIAESMRLNLENAELVARERAERARVERANSDLQAQIERRERIEAELRIAKTEAEAANRAKNQFLANMSHELRTPLNGVLGMAELLLRALPPDAVNPKPLKYAQAIRTAGERLLHLINDILDMARIEAGAIRFESASFDTRRLIADAVEAVSEQCLQKNLTVKVHIAPDVPRELRGDSYRLRQVLTNLLSNAVKFTERGAIELKVELLGKGATDLGRGVRLRWSVIDTGIGIAPEARSRLFQPFSQLDDSFTRRHGGSGLGLAICKQIVTALGGTIDVNSTPGVGSTFWFEVPLELSDHTTSTRGAQTLPAPHSLAGRVLVAEDNETNCQLIVEMLELAGCTTCTVTNGAESLEKLEAERFDAVLMDWHMPKLDGLAATRAWRERESARAAPGRLPIIALTASVLPGDREACLRAGMDDFIPKPFTYSELVETLERWLPKKVLSDE